MPKTGYYSKLEAEQRRWNARLKAEGLGVIRPSAVSVGNPDRYTASQKWVGQRGGLPAAPKPRRNRGRGTR